MKIKGLEGITHSALADELQQGGKFVIYSYCFSVIIMTFRRNSAIYYIAPQTSALGKSLKYTLITLLLGWWGFPWGPIYSIGAIVSNFGGGRDITNEVINSIYQEQEAAEELASAPISNAP